MSGATCMLPLLLQPAYSSSLYMCSHNTHLFCTYLPLTTFSPLIFSAEQAKGTADALSKKKDASLVTPEAEDEDAKECRFQPRRSKQASRAMRNPSCGYDFVSRLDEKGGFMDR